MAANTSGSADRASRGGGAFAERMSRGGSDEPRCSSRSRRRVSMLFHPPGRQLPEEEVLREEPDEDEENQSALSSQESMESNNDEEAVDDGETAVDLHQEELDLPSPG